MKNVLMAALMLLLSFGSANAQVKYEKVSDGTRILGRAGFAEFKILVEESNLGSRDVEIAEITFPAEAYSRDNAREHSHGTIEIFYVLEGVMGHVVNGEEFVLMPGMVGIVRPEDSVIHRVISEEPVRVLAIWLPGEELDRLGGGSNSANSD